MLKVCVPIIETTVEKARRSIREDRHRADLMKIKKDLGQVLGIEIDQEKSND